MNNTQKRILGVSKIKVLTVGNIKQCVYGDHELRSLAI